MNGHICGGGTPDRVVELLATLLGCCFGASLGPDSCTCWEPIYDRPQEPIDTTTTPGRQPSMCADCAYRPDSPERTGDARYSHSTADDPRGPLALTGGARPFWCHQGMRKPTGWRHPAGITVTADTDGYTPPIVDGVPYLADGRAGNVCAGWAAHHATAAT